ncbi:hypothetical protein HCN44_003264 [Aphidius gifuensis]|uniref:E3 ubiquitin-protein ligase FANCL n=1 Tax=Aphidius gifuensis TaxID=684658 RepID=A0A834XKW1_APHGI|nr:hypothetical protein HCN44_003264 [Aphidius gifuensis]
MDEYSEIIKEHPYLILINDNPVSWHGFLLINNNKLKMEIKLIVPNYPSMKNSILRFGKNIYHMHNTDFSTKSMELLHSAISVPTFLRQLQRLMDTCIKKKKDYLNNNLQVFNDNLLDELTGVLKDSDVAVLGNNDLTAIKLTYKNISIVLEQTSLIHNPWTVVSSDLPTFSVWPSLDKCVPSLVEAAKTLKARTDILQDVWDDLKFIDEYCWVIDPINPKPSHMHRRININSSLSLLLTMNPFDSTAIQDMKLLGTDNKWDDDLTIIENLQTLLNIDELPKPPIDRGQHDNVLIGENDCCICFCLELDDGEIPEVICNNSKCHKNFHAACLYKWLEMGARNHVAFDVLYGKCPACKEAISCPIVKNKKNNN